MANEKDLTPKEIRFIEIYFSNGHNATQAMREIDHDISSPYDRVAGHRMITKTNVRAEIERRVAEEAAKRRLTVAEVGDLIQSFAEVDLLDVFNEKGALRPLCDIPLKARRCIQSIETEDRLINGEVTEVVKVKLVDRKGAAELLGKYKKMFTENLDVTSGGKPLRVAVSITGKGRG